MPGYPKVNYIGNKEKLASWIIGEFPVKSGTVLDLFGGGCSVAYALKESGYSVVVNDILYADYVLGKALIENQGATLPEAVFSYRPDPARVKELTERFSFLSERLYYPEETEELARLAALADTLPEEERYLFLALLRRAMIRKLPYSRMNVPWDQIRILRDEEYSYRKYGRRRAYHNQSFESHMRENLEAYNAAVFAGRPCRACRMDAFSMAEAAGPVDAVYLDPPYPSTMNQYDDFYGLFDEMFGLRRGHADFTKRETFLANLEELVRLLRQKAGYLVLSQNTRVKPGPDQIAAMLEAYGSVSIREKKHNYQVTGKENKNGSRELLFLVRFR